MPSKRGTEQAITWLRSKAMEPSLDGINAEVCLNVIRDLQAQNTRKGAIIHNLKQNMNNGYLREDDVIGEEIEYLDCLKEHEGL